MVSRRHSQAVNSSHSQNNGRASRKSEPGSATLVERGRESPRESPRDSGESLSPVGGARVRRSGPVALSIGEFDVFG